MTMSKQHSAGELFDQLKQATVETLANWEKEAYDVPADFNWLGIAEMAETRAWMNESPMKWARVAIAVFERLARERSDLGGPFMVSSMRLRVGMIGRFGSMQGDDILDPDTILAWFLTNNKDSPKRVAEVVVDWKRRSVEEILRLRRIKNQISVIMDLYATGSVTPTNEMLEWISIYESLP